MAGDHLAGRPSPVDIEALALEREPPKAGDPAHDAGAQRDPAVVRQNAINSRPGAIGEFRAEDANIAAPEARCQTAPVGSLRLFDDLEQKEQLIGLLDLVRDAEGVRIFIGAETRLFSLSGSAVIAAPYMSGRQKVLGAIGVIGPARLNYARVIPLVDYTARALGRIMDG